MKKHLLTLNLILATLLLHGQTSILEVVSPAGGYFEASNISLSWTLGEPIIETWVNEGANLMLTSGFQQGDFTLTSVPFDPRIDFAVKMYPNPSRDETKLDITLPTIDRVNVTIIDITGRMVIQEQFTPIGHEHTHTFNVSGLKPGLYLVRIQSGAKFAKVIKLMKQ